MIILFLTAACSTMQAIEPTPAMARKNFKIGDIITVRVDDTVYEFELLEIKPEGIVGRRGMIPFRQIDQLEKKEVSMLKTISAGMGVTYLTVTGAVAVLFLVSLL